jgi:hypothetical protein
MFEHLVACHEGVFLQRQAFGSGKRRVFGDRLAKSLEGAVWIFKVASRCRGGIGTDPEGRGNDASAGIGEKT